jgi:predicted phage tail protein
MDFTSRGGKMINLLIIKNPFEKQTERKQAPYIPGQTIFDYIYPHFMLPENEIEIFYGGRELTTEQIRSIIVHPGDYIVAGRKIMGGGNNEKSILMTVASIGLMMVSGFAGNWATGATTQYGSAAAVVKAGGMAVWNGWGYAAAIGTQIAGGMVLNYFANKNLKEAEQPSPTYGWDTVRPLVGQGQPVPVALGKVGAAGQIIAQHVISEGTTQKLNLLIQCAEGPCDYTGNGEDADCIGIDNIKINNNPIGNFSGTKIYKRAGLNNQSVIPNFENTRIEQQIGVELKYDSVWHTFTSTGDNGSGLELTFTMPALFDQEYKGTRRWENEIRLEIQYKLSTETEWHTHYTPERKKARIYQSNSIRINERNSTYSIGQQVMLIANGISYPAIIQNIEIKTEYIDESTAIEFTVITVNRAVPQSTTEIERGISYVSIIGKYTSAFNHVVNINANVIGQYDVRCRCIYKAAYGDDDAHTIYWSKLAHVIYDDFIYPNRALLSIQALANDQISGSANVTFEINRPYVWVWVPNDPDLDPWGPGSYQEMPANNPAWGCYWLYHRAYRLWNINTNAWEFIVRGRPANRMKYVEFKKWADFCTERGIEVNIYFDTIQKIREAVSILEELGRGHVVPDGTRIGCIFDGPAEKDANGDYVYSQVFNVANIGLDSFSEQWVDVSERATAIEVTFQNSDNNHEKEVMLVPADGLTEGTATGNVTQITIAASVPKLVAWQYCKYKLRLNNYINNTVNITTSINAINSKLGDLIGIQHDVPQWGFGGRIVSATTNQITLDKPVTMEAGKTYSALFWLNNDEKIEKLVVTEPGETSVLTIEEPFENDTLTAEYVDSNLFWVDGDQELLFPAGNLIHLFHSTGDWTEYIISAIYDEEIGKTLVEVTNCPENLQQVRFAWTMPHPDDQWLFGPVEDGIKKHCRPFKIYSFTRENDLTYRITGINYEDAVYQESETVPDIDYSLIEPIFEVESLSIKEETFLQLDGTLVSQINASWILPVGKTADRFLVYYSEDDGLTWFIGADTIDTKAIITNVKTNVSYLIKVVVLKEVIYSVGVVSQPILILGKDMPPSDVTSLIVEQDENMLTATITLVDDPDVDEYELRMGPSLANSYKIIPNFPGPSITFKAPKEGTLTFWCRAVDRSGKYSEIPASYTIQVFNIPPENAIYKADSDLSTWTPTNCWFGLDKKWYIKTVEKIGDFPVFADIFRRETPWTLESSPKLRVPVIDLGADVIEEGLYWIDDKGTVKLRTVKRIGDFPVFADIFRQTEPWELVQPKFVIKTFLGTDITWNQHMNNRVDIFYRTKTDGDQWTEWKPSTEAKFLGRQIDIEIKPISLDGQTNVIISGATFQVDVPEVKEPIKRVDIPVEGLDYTYTRRFYIVPDPWLNCHDINDVPRMAHITNKTKTGCHIALYDDDGNPIAGRIAYGEVIGY